MKRLVDQNALTSFRKGNARRDPERSGCRIARFAAILLSLSFITSCARITPTPVPISTIDPHVIETRVAATVFADVTLSAEPRPTLVAATPTITIFPTETVTRLSTATRTRTPVPPTATRMPAAQKRLDYKESLAIVDLATGNQVKFPSIEGVVTSAAWSPDGKRVLVAWMKSAKSADRTEKYVCGGHYEGEKWVNEYCTSPTYWKMITYGGSLRIYDPAGQNPVDIASGAKDMPQFTQDPQTFFRDAVWSPDGQRIAVLYKDELANQCTFLINSNGSGLRKLGMCDPQDHPRYWSVDGKWMVAWSDNSAKMYAYDINGNRRVPLSDAGPIKLYDQRYYPWKVVEQPTCKSGDYWSCE